MGLNLNQLKNKMVSFQAPAKVIFSGEHAVVYGKPALAAAINLSLTFSLEVDQKKQKTLIQKEIFFISEKVKEFLNKKKIKFNDRKFKYQIESNIPIGYGLGSSAALSTASVAAFLNFYSQKNFSQPEINQLAYEVEKYFHKKPSGIDNTTSCFGGLIYYRKEFEFLRNISVLNFKIPNKIGERLFLIDSGKPKETTKEMVTIVAKRYNKEPRLIESVLIDIEKTTKKMVISLVDGDNKLFKQSLIDNQILLEILGVVSKTTKKLLFSLEPYGVGKITGAGGQKQGSGFILFYAENKEGLVNYLKKQKIRFFKFKVNYQGLKQK